MSKRKDPNRLTAISMPDAIEALKWLGHFGVNQTSFGYLRKQDDLVVASAAAQVINDCSPESLEYLKNTIEPRRLFESRRFFGLEQWRRLFDSLGIAPEDWYSKELVKAASNFPWSTEVLQSQSPFDNLKIHHTHFAFLGIPSAKGNPLDVNFFFKAARDLGNFKPEGYESPMTLQFFKPFTGETLEAKWYLVPMMPHMFRGKTYQEQVQLIPSKYQIAPVNLEVTKQYLHFNEFGTGWSGWDPYTNYCSRHEDFWGVPTTTFKASPTEFYFHLVDQAAHGSRKDGFLSLYRVE